MTKKRIWIVTHFSSDFDSNGNNRFNYFAKSLAENGYEVEFFTSDFSHVKKKPRSADGAEGSYDIHLIHEPGYPKNVCFERIYSHKVFGKNLKKELEKRKKPDAVYLAIPSLDAGAVTVDYCKKNNIPCVIDIQDLWPEAFQIALRKFHIPGSVLYSMNKKADYIYKNCDKVVAVSDTYLERAYKVRKDRDGKCVFIGTDLSVFDSYEKITSEKDGKVWIAYIGTLGNSYNIDIVIDAVRILLERGIDEFSFRVFGDGPAIDSFKEHAKGLPVEFYGRLAYKDMVGHLKNCDIAVNPIVKGAAQSIINKHADYAAAGLPVVNTQECEEYRNLMTDYACGINCDVESVQQVADALLMLISDADKRKLMGQNSRRMAEERFDRKNTYKYLMNAIKECLGE